MLRHEPAFYRELEVAPGNERRVLSRECTRRWTDLMNGFSNREETWGAVLTQDQINSYFQEDLAKTGELEVLNAQGVSDPRIGIEADRIRFAFRYGQGRWSTVVTVDLKAWLVARESNVIAVELLGLQAGAMPVATQSLLDYVTEAARKQDVEVSWYRHHGNPVAVLRFMANQVRPSVQVVRLELRDGEVEIRGRSLDSSAYRSTVAAGRANAD
jgi:hypothetical protein